MTKHFAILSTQRSGTHFLSSLLQSSPQVFVAGETFHRRSKYSFNLEDHDSPDGQVTPAFAERELDRFEAALKSSSASAKAGADTIGIILMYNQCQRLPSAFADAMLKRWRILHLIRTNVLRTMVSDFVNQDPNVPAHSREKGADPRVALPCEGLVDKLRSRTDLIRAFRSRIASTNHIEVVYETLAGCTEEEVDRISRFLAVRDFAAKTSLQRTNPSPLRTKLTNYDEVRAALGGTELLPLLSD